MSTPIQFRKLTPESKIKPFDCGDDDLNEFFIKDSVRFTEKLLAVTYVIEDDINTIAFFSLLNDKVSVLDTDSKRKWIKKFLSKQPSGKKFNSYPAMKIGRLGVSILHQRQGYGADILNWAKDLFITNNRTGCRYITVDAYRESLEFYKKNGFVLMKDSDLNSDTQLMYFDLFQLT